MDVMHWNLKQQCLESTLSLTDLRAKTFPAKDRVVDRAPVLSEDKYTPKTLEGNWFERRTVYIPQLVDWKSTYDTDYKLHINKTWKENQIIKWNNKLDLEGIYRKKLFGHKKEYYSNMTTTSDLSYNILPKDLKGPRIRSYHARQRKWVPELDLTKNYGSLTQFGLKEALEEDIYKNSKEGIALCRWQTTYMEEIGHLKDRKVEQITLFNRRHVDFNVPDLKHFEHKSSNIERCLLPFKIKNSK